MTDFSILIKKCLKGQREYQQELYNRFSGLVMGICLRYSPDRFKAEDIFQEAFIKIYQKLGDVQEPKALSGWIRQVTVFTALNHLQPTIWTNEQGLAEPYDMEDEEYMRLLDKLSNEEIVQVINQLPTGYRMVFNMNVIDGYTHKEIADQLNIAESTSRSQLTCAKRLLREKLSTIGINRYESVI